jgi:hypothetical protein
MSDYPKLAELAVLYDVMTEGEKDMVEDAVAEIQDELNLETYVEVIAEAIRRVRDIITEQQSYEA